MKRKFYSLSLILLLICVIVFTITISSLYQKKVADVKEELSLNLQIIHDQIEFEINRNFLIIYNIAGYVSVHPDISSEEFNQTAKFILKQPNNLKNIAMAPNFVISYVYPLEGNESILGIDYRTLPDQWDQAKKAKDENRMILAGPLDLIQGGVGLIARIPVFEYNDPLRFWGIVSSVLNFNELTSPISIFALENDIKIVISDNDDKSSAIFGDVNIFLDMYAVEREINLPDRVWTIALTPTDNSIFTIKEKIIIIIVFFMVFILCEILLGFYISKKEKNRISEERFRDFTLSSFDWVWEINSDYKFIYTSDNVKNILGYETNELTGNNILDLIHTGIDKNHKNNVLSLLNKHKNIRDLELWMLKKGGGIGCIAISAVPVINSRVLTGYRGVGRYITTNKEIEQKLNEYISIVDSNVPILQTDLKADIIKINNTFSKLSGYQEEDLIGKNYKIILHSDMPKSAYKYMLKTITSGEIWEGEAKFLRKDNRSNWFKINILPLIDVFGHHYGYMAVLKDIDAEKKLEELSETDTLTSIYNRRKLNSSLEFEIARYNRTNDQFSIIMIDIDHFKICNDSYGHQVGDLILQEICQIVNHNIRDTDVFGRWGGEEFLIICPETNSTGAQKLAMNLQKTFDIHTFDVVGKVTCSFGVATTVGKVDITQIVKEADDALYKAKSDGRNCVRLSDVKLNLSKGEV
ncbi:MAG: diguanylate cyclase [Spirochaetaceae bacterium]